MKVLLQKSVSKIGNKGDIVEVSNGYGRNFLIPRKLAVPATVGARKDAELHKSKQVKSKEELATQAESLTKILDGKKLEISAKANDKGQLFGSVSAVDIATLASQEAKIRIPTDSIQLANDIKNTGEHPVELKLTEDKKINLTINVTSENGK